MNTNRRLSRVVRLAALAAVLAGALALTAPDAHAAVPTALERGSTLAFERIASSPVPVSFVGLDGQEMPIDDDSVDAVLSTWTLCSIEDAVAAVREFNRVLRPGGIFHFVEHGCSPEPRVLRWQRRLNPVQRRVGGGCRLDSDIPSIIEAGGLNVSRLDTYYAKGDPKRFSWAFEGTASPSGGE